MSFKVVNSLLQEANRKNAIYNSNVETVSAATTLDPNITITRVELGTSGSYTLTLPNGRVGQQKFISAVSGSSNISVAFNNGWGGESTQVLYATGDLLIFYATIDGWHCNDTYTDD
jgi:hypothetical protein